MCRWCECEVETVDGFLVEHYPGVGHYSRNMACLGSGLSVGSEVMKTYTEWLKEVRK